MTYDPLQIVLLRASVPGMTYCYCSRFSTLPSSHFVFSFCASPSNNGPLSIRVGSQSHCDDCKRQDNYFRYEMTKPDVLYIDLLEQCAYGVISSIEKTVSAIKEVEAFSPNNRKRLPLEEVNLVGIFETQGIFQKVRETTSFVEEKLGIEITEWNRGAICSEEDPSGNNQRRTIGQLILFPLLEALFTCYRLIDSIPQPAPQLPRKKNETKPPPPRGMLSLQNYTDVCALLEFTVCSCLLPCLEINVLGSVRDRAQYLLPKSIAGRLPRISLLWGTAVTGEHESKREVQEIKRVVRSVGNVVLLDRFRPMLLSRHLADLYAGIFQCEALEGSALVDPDLSFVRSSLLPLGHDNIANAVDSINQARALQTLLLRGTTGPLWLRKRVSDLLTDLATHDLLAIVQVFVVSAASSQADMTGAALRLSRTLVVVHEDKDYSKLCIPLVRLLDVNVERMSATEFASALTVWAFLDQLDRHLVLQHFLPILSYGIFPENASYGPHRMVRRLLALFAVIPASHSATAICELILAPTPTNNATTLFSQLVRLASFTTLEDALIKLDAAMALRMFFCIMERTNFRVSCEQVEGLGLLSVCLLYAVAPNKWDIDGWQYHLPVQDDTISNSNNLTRVATRDCHIDEESVVEATTTRASVVIKEVVRVTELKADSLLARPIFQHLLVTIFGISQKKGSNHCSPDLRLPVMILLPLLCEAFSPEALLLGTSSDASDILATFKLILDCAASSFDDGFRQSQGNSVSEIVLTFDKASRLFHSLAPDYERIGNQETRSVDSELEHMLMSTASIAISLLTAVLELGSDKRNAKEVEVLQLALPSLRTLSSLGSNSRIKDLIAAKLQAEVAEMSSHAAALIVSREARVELHSGDNHGSHMSVNELIAAAESEIQSNHPAVRAQGVVRLRHLARGCLAEMGEKLPTTPLVVDVIEPLSNLMNVDVLHEIFRVALLTLADCESYVYLAGIQTIVAIADLNPRVIIPVIGIGICTGEVPINAGSQKTVLLTQDERIKLAEALLFVVRRRGAVIDHYMSHILAMMMYGHRQLEERIAPIDATIMQEETHNFFISDPDHANELTAPSDRLESKLIRARSGGPIFMTELNDVLRSSCIAIIVELVDAALPSSIAAYATDLMKLVQHVLRIELSRPLRRVAALLAVALYQAVLREIGETSQVWPLTIAMAKADEEAVTSALRAGMDPQRVHSSPLYDPSTSARCREALDARGQVEETGAFNAVALHLEVQKREDADPVVSIVKIHLNEVHENRTLLVMSGLDMNP